MGTKLHVLTSSLLCILSNAHEESGAVLSIRIYSAAESSAYSEKYCHIYKYIAS